MIQQLLNMNNGKKFDVVLMNPPYGDKSSGGMFLDMQFVKKCNNISKTQISIHPANRWISNTKIGKSNAESKHLKELEILDGNKAFNISTNWKWLGIFVYNNDVNYDTTNIIFNGSEDVLNLNYDDRVKYWNEIMFSDKLGNIIKKTKNLYDSLKSKYKTMINDGNGFIYEENRLQRGKKKYNINKKDQIGLSRVKKYLKEKTYKYCIYKGSGNHDYDEVQEWDGQDPDNIFNGQICWLTNKENVKNNIKYWLECPLCDLWRRFYMNGFKLVSMCAYGVIPALDFEMNESEFKKYVDSLNDFTKGEIQVLQDNKIHNTYKL